MILCVQCGTDNPGDNRFCHGCGVPVAQGCPSCGAEIIPDTRFCGRCGTGLAEGTPSFGAVRAGAESSPPVSERRVCSVLFVDLVGFTTLAESRDPEEVRELLSQYFTLARTVIGRYGGVVEKFIGDAVMAVWGTPVATEGDGERAVRAGLDLVAEVAVLGEAPGATGLAARAGVVTGDVAVTIGATGEGMVAGDAVNTAARVQTAAAPGSVLVDGATRRLTASAIEFDDAGEHLLKGKAAPEQLWLAARVLSAVGGAQRVDGLEAPFTGRDAELRLVKGLFHAAADRRTPRLVVVSGPAGVGKSRVGWEFEKYIDGLVDKVLWHRGRCLSYGEGVAFWALAEIVRQRFGIADDDPVEVAAAHLADGLERFIADPAERSYVGVRLGRLLGVPVAADSGTVLGRDELFAGWRLFFERLAAVQPVVLLVEDAQHADEGLLDFLDHMVDWARGVPLFVLVFTRPELDLKRPGFGAGRNRTALTLDPMDATAMDRVVDALVPGMPLAARTAITARSQGIPLFAVETIRSLIDRDVVVPQDGRYQLVGDVGELVVPDSLHALLAARLDALDPGLRMLTADAAVLGSTFPAEALVAVAAPGEDAVRAGLAELLRREVLEVSADPLSPQRGTYRFSQEMLRQVAYDTLSRRDRKARHLKVAAHLRATFPGDGDEVIDAIARHYLDALVAVPEDPDTTDVRSEAINALVRSAERAGRTGAQGRAADSFAEAAALAAKADGPGALAEAARLWECGAQAARIGDDWAGTIEHAGRARELYATLGEVRAVARSNAVAGNALRRAGRLTEARALLTEALRVLRTDPDADTVFALGQLASLELFAGSSAEAEQLSTEAVILAQAVGVDPGLLAGQFIGLGIARTFANRPAEATCYFEYALRLAERAGDSDMASSAALNLSDVLVRTDPSAAIEVALVAVGHARRTGNPSFLGTALGNGAIALLAVGAWDQAEMELADAFDVEGLDNDDIRSIRAWLTALRGDVVGAADLARLPTFRSSEVIQDRVVIAMVEAFIAAALGEPEVVLRHAGLVFEHTDTMGLGTDAMRWVWPLAARTAHELHDAVTTSELLALLDAHPAGHLPPILRAERQLVRARLLVDANDPAGGVAMEAAITALREVASPYHLAHALLDRAEQLTASGDATGADVLISEADGIASKLRAGPLLDRAAALRGVGQPA